MAMRCLRQIGLSAGHGSTASTNRTAIQRNVTPWLTAVYNFWSERLNRQVETIWRAGEAAKLTDGGSLAKGLAWSKIVAGGAFAYVIWPAIVEVWSRQRSTMKTILGPRKLRFNWRLLLGPVGSVFVILPTDWYLAAIRSLV